MPEPISQTHEVSCPIRVGNSARLNSGFVVINVLVNLYDIRRADSITIPSCDAGTSSLTYIDEELYKVRFQRLN